MAPAWRHASLACSINAAPDDPDIAWLTETWTDKMAHDTATHADSVKAATQRVMSTLAEPPAHSYGRVAYLHEGRH